MASPYVFSYTFLDVNSVKAAIAYYYYPTAPTTVKVADVVTDWVSLGTALDNASNGRILGGRILLPQAADGGWKDTPVAENDLSDVIIVNMNVDASRYPWAAEVPNLKDAELSGGRVNLTQADILALTALLASGGASGAFTNTANQQLAGVRDAFQADRKHRKQLRARSFVTEL